jgi:hypothetical protein
MKALKRKGLTPGPILEGDWSARSGYQAALELVRNYRGEFTAVVSANDHMALGALSAFQRGALIIFFAPPETGWKCRVIDRLGAPGASREVDRKELELVFLA